MTPPHRILDTVRRSRRTLYVVAGLYVVVGFCLALPAAMAGDLLSTFLGFLIISGALALAVGLESIFRLNTHVANMTERVLELRHCVDQIERAPAPTCTTGIDESQAAMMDLASVGRGDPDVLVAATLDRSVFPRLVHILDDLPPPDVADRGPASNEREREREHESHHPPSGQDSGVTTRNLLKEWEAGIHQGDLVSCRNVFSVLVDIADPATVATLGKQLDQLAGRREMELRQAFLRHARRRDYKAVLAVGEEICRQLPDLPIAAEFSRIKPYLLRRAAQQAPDEAAPFRVVR